MIALKFVAAIMATYPFNVHALPAGSGYTPQSSQPLSSPDPHTLRGKTYIPRNVRFAPDWSAFPPSNNDTHIARSNITGDFDPPQPETISSSELVSRRPPYQDLLSDTTGIAPVNPAPPTVPVAPANASHPSVAAAPNTSITLIPRPTSRSDRKRPGSSGKKEHSSKSRKTSAHQEA